MTQLRASVIPFLYLAAPAAVILVMIILVRSTLFQDNPSTLSLGIIVDLAFTAPLLYYFAIRKTSIPNLTVAPFFLLCMAIATYIVPVEHQALLGQIKTFAIPAVELTVITLVLFKIRTLIRHYKFLKQSNTDFFSAMTSAAQKSLPRAVAIFLATEVAAFYYGFVSWKKRPLHSNEFSYHRESGSLNLLSVLIFLILAETLVLHLVITIWSDTAAWILTGISIYSGFQLLGMTRSLTKRPHEIREQSIILRHGVLAETTIPKEVIERIVPFSGDITERKEIKTLSPLGSMDSYNVLLTLKSDQILSSLYGGEKTFQYLAFHVDDKEKFMDMLQNAGSVHQSTSAAPDVSSIYL